MNTKKSNLLNWRNKRTTETADPNAKVVLSDDTFVDFSEITTDVELEKVEEEVEQLSEVVTEQGEQLDDVEGAVSVIESKIPTEASSQNQLADKDFVNESVSTASADFKGTYNSLQELEQVEANANDYGFVIVADEYGNSKYDRYKYTENEGWLYEYSVNSVQFSNAQWNAINSGIVDSDVTKLNALPTASQLQTSLNSKVDKETGKGLSTNDYTNAEKTKLGDLPTNAELQEDLDSITDKLVTDDVPTAGSDNLVKSGGVASAISGAVDALDATVGSTTVASGKHVAVQIVETNGILTAVLIGEDNIANAIDLGDISSLDTQTKASVVSAINELVAKDVEIEEIVDLVNTVLGPNDAETFDPVDLYYTGDFVLYNDKLYKFTRNHTGAWDANDVIETNLFLEIDRMVKSDYEQVNIELKTETGEALPNVEVVVTVEGEDAPRNLITDSAGKCTTNITKGVEYTIACASVPNYYPVETVVRRASIPVRYVNFTYIEDDTLTRESVKITLTYADSTLTKATWVRVSYGGENYQLALDENNVAETSVPLGTQYTVTFEDIEGYKTPAPQTYTAQLHGTRNINVRYNAPVSGVKWLMKNGAERELNDVTNTERLNGDIFGLIVLTSDLMLAGCSYVIPLAMLLTQSATGTGQWLSSNVTVPHLQYFGSHAAALADFDGESNCLAIEQFIAEKAAEGTTYTSSMVSNCRNRVGGAESFKDTVDYAVGDYVVYRNMLHVFTSPHTAGAWVDGETESMYGYIMPDGRVRRCFLPSYAQIYAFRLLRDRVNGFTTDVFGIGCCAIASGFWWTSTQCNARYGVYLSNGSFNDRGKDTGGALLPVLAY